MNVLRTEPALVGFDDFVFARPPRPEQFAGFLRARDEEYWGHIYDPRVGKTKVVNDTFRWNYDRGRVDAMVVVAYPADVHLVWGDEVPKDFTPDFLARSKILIWRRGRMATARGRADLEALFAHDGPKVLTMNCEAILTDLAWNYLRRFFRRWRCLLVADEDWLTNWSARTRRGLAMARSPNAVMRRWLTGTPAEESPEDTYYPTTFLRPGVLGFTSMAAFKARYWEYETEERDGRTVRKQGFNRRTSTYYDIHTGYQNLPELTAKLAQFTDKVRRTGSEKRYAPRYFTLTDRQRRVYDRLRDEYVAELAAGEFGVADVLTRATRLQMVARNHYPPTRTSHPCPRCVATGYLESGDQCEACEGMGYEVFETGLEYIDSRNPAAEALAEEVRFSGKPFVVWCRFQQDVTDALAAVRAVTERVARYDGQVSHPDRRAAYEHFRAGLIDGIVATEKSSISRGHDLSRAHLAVYYSNEWSGRDRKQSEDRTETADPGKWTDVVDLIAADTRDLEWVEAMRAKRGVAALVMGDEPGRWL